MRFWWIIAISSVLVVFQSTRCLNGKEAGVSFNGQRTRARFTLAFNWECTTVYRDTRDPARGWSDKWTRARILSRLPTHSTVPLIASWLALSTCLRAIVDCYVLSIILTALITPAYPLMLRSNSFSNYVKC